MRTNVGKSKEVTATKEDYIRGLYILEQNKSDSGVTSLAKRLKLSKSTVSERVKDLVKDGYVEAKPYESIKLTTKGYDLGAKMTYKHRLIEVFLNEVLKIPVKNVHEEAEKLEHAFSDTVTRSLAKFLNYPKSDPHGSRLPKIKNWK